MEERKKTHRKAYQDVISQWQATGEVLTEEKE
jgi:hypothetical protein